MTKENLFGCGACSLFSHRVTYSLHDGGSHGMNLAMAGVMHPKTLCIRQLELAKLQSWGLDDNHRVSLSTVSDT